MRPVRLSVKAIRLILVVSIDHKRLSPSHSLFSVAPASSPGVTVSKSGAGEQLGLRERSIPPSALKLVAYRVPSAETANCANIPPVGLSISAQVVLSLMLKR